MNFDPVKYVNETLSRGEKLTLLHFLQSLIGRSFTYFIILAQSSYPRVFLAR